LAGIANRHRRTGRGPRKDFNATGGILGDFARRTGRADQWVTPPKAAPSRRDPFLARRAIEPQVANSGRRFPPHVIQDAKRFTRRGRAMDAMSEGRPDERPPQRGSERRRVRSEAEEREGGPTEGSRCLNFWGLV